MLCVSYEAAKLLKSIGFNEQTYHYYNYLGEIKGMAFPSRYSNHEYAAPEILKAATWLRDTHNILITPYATSLGWYFEIYDCSITDITGSKALYKIGIPTKEQTLESYEEATNAAIEYTLKNKLYERQKE